MTTVFISHEVKNGDHWAKAWKQAKPSRHELFAKLGIKTRTFRDQQNPNVCGVLADVPDMAKFQAFLASDEGKKAMEEDGLKVETVRMLMEFSS